MKKVVPSISLIFCCLSLISCSNTPTNTTTEIANNPTPQSQPTTSPITTPTTFESTNESTKNITQQPKIGTVKELVNGDLLCYLTLVDEQGKEHQVGASFDICAEEGKYLNKKVRATYTIESINDCESAEPCGKTRQESIITKMELVENQKSSNSQNNKSPSTKNNNQTISNGEWTITTSNHNSWTGVNNTGNLSYKGCDSKGQCLELTGGKISCRDGKCVTGWTNGDYIYILEQPITEDGNDFPTLIVRKGTEEILKATGFKLISTN
ncbi:hypothetical protein WJM97_18970 [Okeanomitos corallinicola TIOX110]|jgi:hypothetical protein|uniref:Lipoprotein n=1 Tax=Okeanomitos corallinicola TIOX110 TaxID=3133117 RepID=A0ABZ2UQK5_9CYAN